MGFIEDQIVDLEKKQSTVMEQYKACLAQARSTLNASDQPQLEEQAERLKREYEDLNRKIERLRRGEPPELTPEAINHFKAELRNEWEARLHMLNYARQENDLHRLVWVKQQAALLLFVRHRIRMKADLYIKRILKNGRIFDKSRLHPPFIEDFSHEERINPQRFIERWLGIFKIDPTGLEFESAVRKVIQTLQHAVAPGQILCLEIRVKEVSEGFLGWLRKDFWKPLAEALLHPSRGISAIILLTAEADLPKGQIRGEWCCSSMQFDSYKYCEIKLSKWQHSDIKCWMNAYLNPSLVQRHLPTQDALMLARQVYEYSEEGVPFHAHNYILGDLLTQVVKQLPGRCHATN